MTDVIEQLGISDPLEQEIVIALGMRGWAYEYGKNGFDFYIPAFDLYIEVKRFHSERTITGDEVIQFGRQMMRAENIIVVQGKKAVECLAEMIIG